MINRRQLIQMLGAAAAAVGLPKITTAQPVRRTIEQLVAIHFDPMRAKMRNGRPWVSDALNRATDEGRIKIISLAATVELAGTDLKYEVQQHNVPVTWTRDYDTNNTQEGRERIAISLIENSITAAEDLIEERILPGHVLLVSKQYRIEKGATYETIAWSANRVSRGPALYFLVYTAYAAIPLDVYERWNRGELS